MKLATELRVGKLEDWYNVSSQVVQDLGISGSFLKRNGDLPGMTSVIFFIFLLFIFIIFIYLFLFIYKRDLGGSLSSTSMGKGQILTGIEQEGYATTIRSYCIEDLSKRRYDEL